MTFATAAALTLTLSAALSVEQVTNPRPGGSWITDQAGIIPAETARRLDQRLSALERDLGVEIAVVTVRDIDRSPKDFATRLFAHWGIGKARADNGLLVLLVVDQRRLEMETGYGVEAVLPDGWLAVMQNEAMVPAFRSGDYAGGIEAGLARIDQRLRAQPDEARGRGDLPAPQPLLGTGHSGPLAEWVMAGAALVAAGLGLAIFLIGRWRRRQRTCPKCQIQMRLLDEVEDDQHLDAGQRAEERLGSVDYRVYICGRCQHSKTVAHTRWFSGYSRCSACHYRTLSSGSVTLVSATYDHGGQVEVTEICHQCPHRRRYIRHTAALTPPSTSTSTSSSSSGSFSSSSSGGGSSGSFGGGHSGGGGAGSSW
jgi:uncharacterized protein